MSRKTPLNIAVLCGGLSPEREVSLASGAAAAKALQGRGHHVRVFDPAEISIATIPWRDFDIAFLAMHGSYGEDGQLQGELDRLGVCYTGSGAKTSRLAFSKSAAKRCFDLAGVDTPRWDLLHHTQSIEHARLICRRIGFPLAVKPDQGGSSLGVSIVSSEQELPQALELAWSFDQTVVVESAIVGTEWTLGLIDGEPLPLIQIESSHELFTYEAKYHDRTTVHRFDFDLPPLVVERIRELGCAATEAVGAAGIARVDLRVDRALRPWVLEVNTIPGLTETSLVPDAALHAGWSMADLCEKAIDCARCSRRAA